MSTGWKFKSRWIAILLLAATPACGQAQTPIDNATGADSLASGSLTVWVSCRQKKDADAMALKLELGLTEDYPKVNVQFKGFSNYEFLIALSVAGKTGGEPPDMIYTDDSLQVKLLTKGATFMAGLPRFSAPGTWLIPANASNPKVARAFMLWLEEPPPGKLLKLDTQLLSTDDASEIRKSASAAAEAFDTKGKAPGVGIVDPALADFAWNWAGGEAQRYTATVNMLGGNKRLAFAGVSALEEGESSYGLIHATVILRKLETSWQVVCLLPNESFSDVDKQLKTLDELQLKDDLQSGITFLSLLSPLDQAQLSRSSRAEFEIEQEGELGGMLAIEWQSMDGIRKLWSPTTLTMLRNGPKPDHIVQSTITFTGRQPHRWRAWSINQSGVVTLSGWHNFSLTY